MRQSLFCPAEQDTVGGVGYGGREGQEKNWRFALFLMQQQPWVFLLMTHGQTLLLWLSPGPRGKGGSLRLCPSFLPVCRWETSRLLPGLLVQLL